MKCFDFSQSIILPDLSNAACLQGLGVWIILSLTLSVEAIPKVFPVGHVSAVFDWVPNWMGAKSILSLAKDSLITSTSLITNTGAAN